MKLRHQPGLLFIANALACALLLFSAAATEPVAAALSAEELATKLSRLQVDGSSYVRLRLEVKQPPDTTKIALQVQIKQRRIKTSTLVIYQILWPKERQGEAVLLIKNGSEAASGSQFLPPNTMHPLDSSDLKAPLFGSDLAYADLLENFYAWKSQTLIGPEVVNRVRCQVLESKPGKDEPSIYASVRSWVDPVRMVPLRVEKRLASGQLARILETTRVIREEDGFYIPADLSVRGTRKDSITELSGSRLRRDVNFDDAVFTREGLLDIKPPAVHSP